MKKSINIKIVCYILIVLTLFQSNLLYGEDYKPTGWSLDKKAPYEINVSIMPKTNDAKVKSKLKRITTSQERLDINGTHYLKINSQGINNANLKDTQSFEVLFNSKPSILNLSGAFIRMSEKSGRRKLISFLNNKYNVKENAENTLFKNNSIASKTKLYIIKRFLGVTDSKWYCGSNGTSFSFKQGKEQKELHVVLNNQLNDVVIQKLFNKLDLSKNNFIQFDYSLDDIAIQNVSIKCGIDFNNDNRIDSYIDINKPGENIAGNMYSIKTNLYETIKSSFPNKKTYNLREVIIHFQKREGATIDTPKEVIYGINSFSVYSQIPDASLISKFINDYASYKPEDIISLTINDYIFNLRNQYGFKVNLDDILSQNNIASNEITISNPVIVAEGDKQFLKKNDLIDFMGLYSEDIVEYPSIIEPYVTADPDGILDQSGRIKNLFTRKPNNKLYFGLSKKSISNQAFKYRWQVEADNTKTIIIPDNEGVVYTKKLLSDNVDEKVVLYRRFETPMNLNGGRKQFILDINPQDPKTTNYSLNLGDDAGKEISIPLTYYSYSEMNGFRRFIIDLKSLNLKNISYVKLIYSIKNINNKNVEQANESGNNQQKLGSDFTVSIRTAKIIALDSEGESAQVLANLIDKNTYDLIGGDFEGWKLKTNNAFNIATDAYGTRFGLMKNEGIDNYTNLSKKLLVNVSDMPYFQMNGSINDNVQKVKVEFNLLVDSKPEKYSIDYNFGEEVNLKGKLESIWKGRKILINELNVMLYCSEEAGETEGYKEGRYVFTLQDVNFYNRSNSDLIGFLKNEKIIEPNSLSEYSIYDAILDTPLVRLDGKMYSLRNVAQREGYNKADEIIKKMLNGESSWITLDRPILGKGAHDIRLMPGNFAQAQLLEVKEYKPNESPKNEPVITFHKVNPTRYIVDVTAEGSFWLVFSESFHPGWKAYILKNTSHDYLKDKFQWSAILTGWKQQNDRIEVKDHHIVNGYANGWWVDIKSIQKSKVQPVKFQMVLEYKAQQYFEIGVIISVVTLFVCIAYLVYDFMRKRRKEHYAKINNQ